MFLFPENELYIACLSKLNYMNNQEFLLRNSFIISFGRINDQNPSADMSRHCPYKLILRGMICKEIS